ncbi:MAG: hypothetical protein EOP02_06725 [Proteobacteria bacterium]|nr:MAG: hypothetical protein EOP02_06725 [Pseudomonadota bacterium]
MRMLKTGFAASLLAAGALAQPAFAQSTTVSTPEGVQMDANADLAYKPGELSQEQLMSSTRDLFRQNSMNTFRRFPREQTEAMVKFYTEALALKSLNPIQLTSSQQMLLTRVGSGQVKLAAGQQGNRKYVGGGYKAATGLRIYTLTYPDAEAVKARFAKAGFDAPVFTDQGDGTSSALVTDPAGFSIQLVAKAGAKDGSDDGVGIGISVSDLEKAGLSIANSLAWTSLRRYRTSCWASRNIPIATAKRLSISTRSTASFRLTMAARASSMSSATQRWLMPRARPASWR